jgi:hypothetical protein
VFLSYADFCLNDVCLWCSFGWQFVRCVLMHVFWLQMQVAGMPAYTDLTRAHEIANQARRLHKDLRDALNDAAKYNNRERLFDMPVTNVSKPTRSRFH